MNKTCEKCVNRDICKYAGTLDNALRYIENNVTVDGIEVTIKCKYEREEQ